MKQKYVEQLIQSHKELQELTKRGNRLEQRWHNIRKGLRLRQKIRELTSYEKEFSIDKVRECIQAYEHNRKYKDAEKRADQLYDEFDRIHRKMDVMYNKIEQLNYKIAGIKTPAFRQYYFGE